MKKEIRTRSITYCDPNGHSSAKEGEPKDNEFQGDEHVEVHSRLIVL